MKYQWKCDQFGAALAGSLDRYEDLVLDLKPDLVQVPLHLYLPSLECCQRVTDQGIQIIGKMILSRDVHDVPLKPFKELFRRYKGLIKIWDFGGEPETPAHEPGCRFSGTPQEFVTQMWVFHDVGKQTDPENVVGGCGWITPTFNGYFGNPDRSAFFSKCLGLGIQQYLDFVSLNFYSYGYGGTKNIYMGTAKVKELLARYGVEKPLVVSEYGVPCSGDPQYLHIIQTEERQAVSLVEQQILFASLGIDYAIWFALQYEGWGSVDMHGRERPANKAMKTLMKLLKGSTYAKQLKAFPSGSVQERWLTDKVQWHVFTCADGDREVHVIWLTGGASLERKFSFADVQVYDLFGCSVDVSSGLLRLDHAPRYLVANRGAVHSGNFLLF